MTEKNICNVGGQAVIEGVMMKSPNYVSVAVRKSDKKIIVKAVPYSSASKKYKILSWPFVRGIVTLFEMLILGITSLTISANEVLDDIDDTKDENEEDKKSVNEKIKPNKKVKANKPSKLKEELSVLSITFMIIFSLVFGIGLFVVAPYAITVLLGFHEEKNSLMFNFIDGIIKLFIFFAYLLAMSLMKDVRTVFQYHGAEHKAVNCYEAGLKLNVENCQKFSTKNPRCGTSFLLFVILLGVLVFSFVPLIVTTIWPNIINLELIWRKLILISARLLFLFPLAAISYEFLKMTSKFSNYKIMKMLMLPGMLVQKITTKEPTNEMVEVAIKAIEDVLKKEKKWVKEEVALT